MQCQAKSKRTGEQCKRHATLGKRVCKFHGGHSLGGIASPTFKHGRHSKYLPKALQERYQEGIEDPELLELRAEIALVDARISELTETVEEAGSAKQWGEIRKLWSKFSAADGLERDRLQAELHRTIQSGVNRQEVWDDISNLVDRRRKLVDTEQRRLMMSQQMLTVEQTMLLLSATINALREAVYLFADPTTARHILADAQRKYSAIVSLPDEGS